MTCPASFYDARCENPPGHSGPHHADAGAGITTIWNSPANDPPTPHYQDPDTTLYHGDCLNILPTLADNSIDAVITDPPYGLEFMGKQWDRIGDIGQASHAGFTDGTGFKGFRLPTGYNASANIKCQNCAKWRFDHIGRRCECGAPSWPNVKAQQGRVMQDWHQAWAAECLRVLKPGGHLLAFGGTRTWHRLTCAIEDAGFEIRDSIAWLYGSGFPKSLDVSKAIDKAAGAEREIVGRRTDRAATPKQDIRGGRYIGGETGAIDCSAITVPATPAAKQWQGWGTALKPAHEPIIVARKPIQGTVANNVLAHGTGGLNIDACRVATTDNLNGGAYSKGSRGADLPGAKRSSAAAGMFTEGGGRLPGQYETPAGRWPTNVVLDQTQAAELDKQSGTTTSGPLDRSKITAPNKIDGTRPEALTGTYPADSGGASRFYPTFKYHPKAPATERPNHDGTAHPTVKPVDLIRWLIQLVTPPGGTVLDPFAGTGTTAEAAIKEHKHAILIEREATYMPLIVVRLSQPMEIGFDFDRY